MERLRLAFFSSEVLRCCSNSICANFKRKQSPICKIQRFLQIRDLQPILAASLEVEPGEGGREARRGERLVSFLHKSITTLPVCTLSELSQETRLNLSKGLCSQE